MRVEKNKSNWKDILLKWQGANGMLWEYQVSHKILTIRLQHLNYKGNLHIICGDTSLISGPVKFQHIHFIIECIDEEIWKITEINSGLSLVCGIIELKENVEPVY